MDNFIAIFEGFKIRRHYDEQTDTWYFSVVDVVAALTDSVNPRDYWFKMKIRVKSEDGLELSTICRQLKMKAPDGKMRLTDARMLRDFSGLFNQFHRPKRNLSNNGWPKWAMSGCRIWLTLLVLWTGHGNTGSSMAEVKNGFSSG